MNTKLPLLFSLLFFININAQIEFNDHIITSEIKSTIQPSTIRTADIDNDGDLDVVSSFLVDDKLVWYENIDGEGNFGFQKIVDVEIEDIQAIFIKDIDGDGDVDIVGVNDGGNSYNHIVFLYKNIDGLGTFSEQIIVTRDIRSGADVALADIDNDGDMDVVSASSNKIALYKNIDGLGNFESQLVLETPLNGFRDFSKFEIKDLDSDNDLDIVFLEHGTVNWIENLDGQGSFSDRILIHSISGSDFTSIHVQDFDGDSDNDILYTHFHIIGWLENVDGLGDFATNNIINSDAKQAQCAYTEDLDGDGDFDIISASKGNSTVEYYENLDGLGTFGTPNILSDNTRLPQAVYAADINNDGKIDILTASQADHKLQWFKSLDGLGNFSLPIIISKNTDAPFGLGVADFNSDEQIDILVVSDFDREVSWFPNNASQFDVQHVVVNQTNPPNSTFSYNPVSAYSVDIDSDGDMDIIAGFSNSEISIVWYENRDGMGDFGNELPVSEGINQLRDIYPIDIDNDGDIDVISADSGQYCRISLFRNENSGIFSTEQMIYDPIGNSDMTAQISSIQANDVDGDNDMDILFTLKRSIDSGNITVWIENLDGIGETFSDVKLIDGEGFTGSISSFYSSDLDGDGDIDVVSASHSDQNIAWYENSDGLGKFGSQQIISASSIVTNVISLDIDGDGDQDVISNQNGLTLFENINSLGSFDNGQLISSMSNNSIKSGDFDGDGDLDLATTSVGYDRVAWHENLKVNNLSINESKLSYFKIFPNPTKGILNIISKSPVTNLVVYNNIGQVVLSEFNKTAINISVLSSGLYFIKIKDDLGNSETKKIIKE
ncbi:T9SS type A sorting domain-containing protein [Algibacter sp. TI.3.09]|uniref:T9SS type A sorting domain-containing protein n=1 Tax=Algibacter sp. TI.3.09 TaxID=3121298 RepID=UPI00311D8794